MKKHRNMRYHILFTLFIVLANFVGACSLLIVTACSSFGAASAEEYFAIGMAYYDIGKFEEAEKWLNRARAKDKTKSASEYNLGRIAFEAERYDDAIKYFESILKRDPNNVLALKAAAYTHIRNGDIERAATLYDRVLILVPESADDGYNYALVLFAMKKYPETEQVLKNHEFALLDNPDVLLLYARSQKEQGKPEAIDNYAKWLINNTDAAVRYEYAQLLEGNQLYARALEEYRLALTGLTDTSVNPSKAEARFTLARLILIADSGNAEGITEMKGAVSDGFSDTDKVEALLTDERISNAQKNELRTIVADMKRTAAEALAAKAAAEEAAAAARDAALSETQEPEQTEGEQTE